MGRLTERTEILLDGAPGGRSTPGRYHPVLTVLTRWPVRGYVDGVDAGGLGWRFLGRMTSLCGGRRSGLRCGWRGWWSATAVRAGLRWRRWGIRRGWRSGRWR